MRLVQESKACYGCRACELICSFHYHGEFSPGGGAIRVRKDNRTGKVRWRMTRSCDFCEGEPMLLCVKYCTYRALTVSREEN